MSNQKRDAVEGQSYEERASDYQDRLLKREVSVRDYPMPPNGKAVRLCTLQEVRVAVDYLLKRGTVDASSGQMHRVVFYLENGILEGAKAHLARALVENRWPGVRELRRQRERSSVC